MKRHYLIVTITAWADGYEKEGHYPIEIEEKNLNARINEILAEDSGWCNLDGEPNYSYDNPYTGYTFFDGFVREYLSHIVSITEEDYNVLRRYL